MRRGGGRGPGSRESRGRGVQRPGGSSVQEVEEFNVQEDPDDTPRAEVPKEVDAVEVAEMATSTELVAAPRQWELWVESSFNFGIFKVDLVEAVQLVLRRETIPHVRIGADPGKDGTWLLLDVDKRTLMNKEQFWQPVDHYELIYMFVLRPPAGLVDNLGL